MNDDGYDEEKPIVLSEAGRAEAALGEYASRWYKVQQIVMTKVVFDIESGTYKSSIAFLGEEEFLQFTKEYDGSDGDLKDAVLKWADSLGITREDK